MASLLHTIAYALILTIPAAVVVWIVLAWLTLNRKKRHMSSDTLTRVQSGQDTTAVMRFAFGYTTEMLNDPILRRLRFWSRAAIVWPVIAISCVAVIFNLFPVSSAT